MFQRTVGITVGAMLLGSVFLICQHFSSLSSTSTTVAPSSTTISVPMLREVFTTLPCNQVTTIGLEGCAEHQILGLDRRINNLRRRLFAALRTATPQADFVAGEAAWTAYRSSLCLSEAGAYQSGSLAPVVFANCLVHGDQRHLVTLREFKAQLSQP